MKFQKYFNVMFRFRWLFYTALLVVSCDTLQEEKDETKEFLLELSLEGEKTNDGFKLRVTTSEEPDYFLYWCGKAEGSSVTEIAELMKTEPDTFIKAIPGNSEDLVDGCFLIGGAPDYFDFFTDYLFVTVAVRKIGEQYHYSQPAYYMIRYEKTLGYISSVDENGMSNMEWVSMRPVLTFDEESFEASTKHIPGHYSFALSCSKDITAYVVCAGDWASEMSSVDMQIDKIVSYSDTYCQQDKIVSEDDWKRLGFPYGWKLMLYAHGNPNNGACVYLPESYSSDEDPVYQQVEDKIEEIRQKWPADSEYCEGAVPICCVNDGTPLSITQPYAIGDKSGVDRDYVYVLLKNTDGMYYEPYSFVVPNYFK